MYNKEIVICAAIWVQDGKFDVYDKDETKLIYGIEIGILKEMFGI